MNHKATTSKVCFLSMRLWIHSFTLRLPCLIYSVAYCAAWHSLQLSFCFQRSSIIPIYCGTIFPQYMGIFSHKIREYFPTICGNRQSLDVTMWNLESNTTTPFYWSESLFVTRMPLAQGNEFISEKRVLLLN